MKIILWEQTLRLLSGTCIMGPMRGKYRMFILPNHPRLAPLPFTFMAAAGRACVSAILAQTTLDPEQMRAWVGPEITYGPHAFGIAAGPGQFEAFLAARKRLLPWIKEYSPAALLSRTSAPIFLDYRDFSLTPCEPLDAYYTHSPRFGLGFLKLADRIGAECYLRFEGHEAKRFTDWEQFLIAKLTNSNPTQESGENGRFNVEVVNQQLHSEGLASSTARTAGKQSCS